MKKIYGLQMLARFFLVMFGLMVLLLIIALFSLEVEGYVPVEYLSGIPIKQYVPIDDECRKIIKGIPKHYYDGIKAIRFFPEHRRYMGFYHISRVIDMYGNCEDGVLRHELGHHLQWIYGDSLYNVSTHQGSFKRYHDEIRNA